MNEQSLLGIDIGTTGTKVIALSAEGAIIASAHREYDLLHPQPGWSELDSRAVWQCIQDAIREVAGQTTRDPIVALSMCCMGEAMTPVSKDRTILGNCILGFDIRGGETTAKLSELDGVMFFERSGNIASPIYAGQKLIWLRDNQPELFNKTYKFLSWSALAAYMLGSDPTEDYSFANRTIFMDVRKAAWSAETLDYVGMPADKLPALAQAGTVVGTVSPSMTESLGLPPGVKIVLGAHDQPTSALGSGAIQPGMASYTIGSYICINPAYDTIPPARQMIQAGLNVEHHAVAGLYVSFMYNPTGGTLLKWFRDTFARLERAEAQATGRDIYDVLLAEMPAEPTDLLVLPHFAPTGPPDFDPNPTGLIAGLTLETTRGQFIKGLLEGLTYYFRYGLNVMADAGIHIREYRMTGGGARSDAWLQIKADILGRELVRPKNVDASALGAAILAGIGSGMYQSVQQAVDALVQIDRVFEPDPRRQRLYDERFARYRLLYPFSKSLR
ncbi:MAG: hypothetical protein IT324_28025 [Anaerolineae bacterium]|nr:hypothetical protein [Anaerolineae bacterium]